MIHPILSLLSESRWQTVLVRRWEVLKYRLRKVVKPETGRHCPSYLLSDLGFSSHRRRLLLRTPQEDEL